MGGLVQGAALGAAFDILFMSLVEATRKAARFSSDLNRLTSTLYFIKLVIDDIDSFNKILERPQHETQAFIARLIKGEKLVQKCSRMSVVVSNLEEKINEIMTVLKRSEIGGCNSDGLPEIVVGDYGGNAVGDSAAPDCGEIWS
ncbi:hypothetical protein DH2020_037296 [Rehmannia glutinosa]|uniref:RPW8 domain-containing protein n=1 Tax=Rehmannia glutinosa TaxID=99300 RepID=A0ABR0V2G6_REHGL